MNVEGIMSLKKSIDHWNRIYKEAEKSPSVRIGDLKVSVLTKEEKDELTQKNYCFLCEYVIDKDSSCRKCPMYGHWPTSKKGVTAKTCYHDINSLYSLLCQNLFLSVNQKELKEVSLSHIKNIVSAMERRLNELESKGDM